MRRLARSALIVLLVSGSTSARAGGEAPPPHLVPGQIATLFPSVETRTATALVDVPPGIRMLHVFVSAEAVFGLTVEEGPIGEAGQFLEFIRHEKQRGPLHLVRTDPTPGLHRVVVFGPFDARGGAAVHVAFDTDVAPPIVDLRREGLPGFVRKFRLYVPPHEGTAVLRSRAAADGIRVRLLGPRGDIGEDVPLPATLAGTESGGMYVVEILRGTAEALATLELYVSRAAGQPSDAPLRPRRLVPGTPISVFLGGHGSDQADFLLMVPPGSAGYAITARASAEGEDVHPDPDIYVRRGRPIDSPIDDADYLGIGRGVSESVRLGGTNGLPADEYYVRVSLVDGEQPGDVTVLATGHPEGAAVEPSPLALDAWVSGSIHAETSVVTWFDVGVPPEAASLRLQVVDATSDVDLFVVDPESGAIVGRSVEFQIDECLACRPFADRRSRWLVGVASRSGSEDDVDFRIAASIDRAPTLPSDLRLPPFARSAPQNEVETAASAVAEIEVNDGSGSAVCVDPRGYLLTCRHVIVDDATGGPTKGAVLVAFPDDLRKAPRQAFRAKVIESDEDLDLALLRIESDVYGRPVPANLGLPSIALGDADALHLGDPLLVVGYPGDGSERSRPPVTVSRGVVAGLEAFRDTLLWIKTDAWIATGHSGGAVLNRGGQVVGVAAATLGSHDAMGLVRPVGLLPAEWLRKVGIMDPRRK